MKLQDLAAPQKTKQIAKVMESYFGNSVAFDQLSPKQAQAMLRKVRGLISEQRRQPGFHQSEQNPAYLKLMMMEQGLAAAATAPVQDPQQAQAAMTLQVQQRKKQQQAQMKSIDDQMALVKVMSEPDKTTYTNQLADSQKQLDKVKAAIIANHCKVGL